MHAFTLSLALGLAAATAGHAANLVVNPDFDDDVSDWGSHFNSLLQHSPDDELGSLSSGSLEIVATSASQVGLSAGQCIPVVEGRTYAIGASARLGAGFQSGNAFVNVTWHATPNCDHPNVDSDDPLQNFVRVLNAWGTSQKWATAPIGAQSAELRLAANTANSEPLEPIRVYFDNVFFLEDQTCGDTATHLCLNEGRFRALVEWETKAGNAGYGRAVQLTDDSGYFWFFNDANVELVVKLLDGCPTQFNTYWVFAAGLTNVEAVLRVRDTVSDTEKIYTNPLDTPFEPIQDTDAFDTCLSLGG